MARLPPWIRLKMSTEGDFASIHNLVSDLSLHTVCQSARCPNIHECWGHGTATLMLLGDVCTRDCAFCAIQAGRPLTLDAGEPERVAEAASRMDLKHVVLTSVARDDLEDGGSAIFAATIRAIRRLLPHASIEVLTPDFEGREASQEAVLKAAPDVYNHNVETVRSLQAAIRPQASYGRSLGVLKRASEWDPPPVVKSGIMLGLGETEHELVQTMRDLYSVGCRLLTLGQYLQPTRHHAAVVEYVPPEEFERFALIAKDLGFLGVASGPMVRSSYHAEELLAEARGERAFRIPG
jgi:lipoic acid synthetase